jgi:nicotinamidase-related amidase
MSSEVDRLLDPLPDYDIVPGRTALIDIDMQYFQLYGLADGVKDAGLDDIYDYYNAQLDAIVPRVRTLKDACRNAGIEVLHVRCASLAGDGRDCSRLFKAVEVRAGPSDRDAQVVEEVGPMPNEIVVSKGSTGVFNGSDLDTVLRHLGVDTLIFTGLVTDGCVEGSVRGAADRGYRVFVVPEACAAWTQAQHDASIRTLGRWFARLSGFEEMLNKLRLARLRNSSAAEAELGAAR